MAALSYSQAAGHLGESYLFQSSDCCQMAATSRCIHAFDTCQEWFLTARGPDISETGKMAIAPITFKQRHKLHVQKYNSSQYKNRKVSLCDCPGGPSTKQVTSDRDTTSFPLVSCSVAGKLAQRSSTEKYIWWKRCNPSVNPAGRSVTLHWDDVASPYRPCGGALALRGSLFARFTLLPSATVQKQRFHQNVTAGGDRKIIPSSLLIKSGQNHILTPRLRDFSSCCVTEKTG